MGVDNVAVNVRRGADVAVSQHMRNGLERYLLLYHRRGTVAGRESGYTGKGLQPGIFTVTISETDGYVFTIAGENATGVLRSGIRDQSDRKEIRWG